MVRTRLSKPRGGQADLSVQHERREHEASQQSPSSSGEDNRAMQMAQTMRKDAKKRLQERRARIKHSHEESIRSIEEAMNSKFDEISRRLTQKYKLRMERLIDILRKRAAIEASMFATLRNTDDAFTFAEKALSHALKKRRQGLTRHQSRGVDDATDTSAKTLHLLSGG
ncbi:hypothetical protein JMJ35_000974 [Cladonia borealis]|uniref:Uncharacterized protein n=1 Tax=Cladonia borealis TaxID=184061 RepID=A0AA39UEA0_9LECA|nr:hypothetical protein JMJ35_000974 [Cladonia borealis]